ncbi:MAG: hypothetical protein K940chlam9_01635, partial [Chlamydiae bacterium]|nr:hypothetical protein [Chlamydiota bacterium]
MNCLPCARNSHSGSARIEPCVPKWAAIASTVGSVALLVVGAVAIVALTPSSPAFLSSL